MSKQALLSLTLLTSGFAADRLTAPRLIELARSNAAGLHDAITSTFPANDLKAGTAWAGHGSDFFFAIQSASKPSLFIDAAPGPALQPVSGDGDLWYAAAQVTPVSRLHAFHYTVNGALFGGRLDLPALGPLSYLQPGVPSGQAPEKMIHASRIYDGMKSEWWIYVPAQYDPNTPAALMVFQDGGGYTARDGNNSTLNVLDKIGRASCRERV